MIASVSQTDPPKLGRRIVRLFRPHRGALAVIVAMILTTSVLSVIGALLVRRVFDRALFVPGGPDLSVLYPLVAALIAIPIVNGVLNLAQTYLTEVVGNRVLEELRNRLFEHLERLSLAFYTATGSGEVQSRLANLTAWGPGADPLRRLLGGPHRCHAGITGGGDPEALAIVYVDLAGRDAGVRVL